MKNVGSLAFNENSVKFLEIPAILFYTGVKRSKTILRVLSKFFRRFLIFSIRTSVLLPIILSCFLIFGTRVLLPVNSLLFFDFSEFYENSSFATGKFLAVFLIFQDEN